MTVHGLIARLRQRILYGNRMSSPRKMSRTFLRSLLSTVQRLLASVLGYDIFISYRRADGSEYAGILEDRLRARFAVFRDETHIEAGEQYPPLLKRRIARCRIFLVVITRRALEVNSWVTKELEMRLASVRKRRFGLFARPTRIVPIFFQSIVPADLQGSDEVVTAIRASNGLIIDRQEELDSRFAARVSDELSKALGFMRLRRIVASGTIALALCLTAAVASVIISGSDARVWKRIDQPPVDDDFYSKSLLPVQDFAVSYPNPNVVMFLARNSLWDSDELEEEFESKEDAFGSEYVMFSSMEGRGVPVKGVGADYQSGGLDLWERVRKDKGWVSYDDSVWSPSVSWELPLDLDLAGKLQADFPTMGDTYALASILDLVYLQSGSATVSLLTKEVGDWRLDALEIDWREEIQGHYRGSSQETSWVLRFGEESEWQILENLNALDIWPLGDTGESALLLTSDAGFFQTDNGGVDWKQANYNETGFADGNNENDCC